MFCGVLSGANKAGVADGSCILADYAAIVVVLGFGGDALVMGVCL
jgi:hypothetical protein